MPKRYIASLHKDDGTRKRQWIKATSKQDAVNQVDQLFPTIAEGDILWLEDHGGFPLAYKTCDTPPWEIMEDWELPEDAPYCFTNPPPDDKV